MLWCDVVQGCERCSVFMGDVVRGCVRRGVLCCDVVRGRSGVAWCGGGVEWRCGVVWRGVQWNTAKRCVCGVRCIDIATLCVGVQFCYPFVQNFRRGRNVPLICVCVCVCVCVLIMQFPRSVT